jgi:DNA repair protein RecO
MLKSEEGIVLSRKKSGEADLEITLLSSEGSLMRVKMHGLRASRHRSQLLGEPGSLIKILLYENRRDGAVHRSMKEGELLDRHEELKGEYEKTVLLARLLRIAEQSATPEPHPDLYRLLLGAIRFRGREFDTLGGGGLDDELFVDFYIIRILKISGLLGDPTICSSCGRDLEKRAHWAVPEPFFYCDACSEKANRNDFLHSRLISLAERIKFGAFVTRTREEGIYLADLVSDLSGKLNVCITEYLGMEV